MLHAPSFNGNKMFTLPTMILMMMTTLSNEMHNIKLLLATLKKTQMWTRKRSTEWLVLSMVGATVAFNIGSIKVDVVWAIAMYTNDVMWE